MTRAKKPDLKRGKTNPTSRARRKRVLMLGLGLILAVLCLDALGAFDLLEYKSLDARFRFRGPRPLQVPAVIVAIDDSSLNGWLDASGQNQYMPDRWTWPRDFYARAVRNLSAAGARLIAFDVSYSESSKRNPGQDADFGAAAKEAGDVFFIERVDPRNLDGNHSLKVETLIPPLDAAKAGVGFVNVAPSGDGFLRSFEPLIRDSSGVPDPDMPNADLVILRQLLGIKGKPSYDSSENVVHLGDRVIPLQQQSVDINYIGPAGTVPTVPFHDVYFSTMDMGFFKDKVVYIGSTSEILKDKWLTPFSNTSGGTQDFPGVEARVNFLDTLWSQQYLHHLPLWFEPLSVLLLGLLTILLTLRLAAVGGLMVTLLISVAWSLGVLMAFESGHWVLPWVGPLVAVIFPFAGLAIYRGVGEEKDSRRTRQMFSKYVSKQIVDEILRNPDTVKLGGELKETTVLFSDVRGFTALSERLSAPEVVEILNEYLTAMVDIVIANDGTVDKYVGDAIMAVWGSPLADPQHRRKALRTAVQMMEALAGLQARWAVQGRPPLDIGIGLNTGFVVAGNMGHPHFKMDYTVIGDSVNLAARMETANRELGTKILITQSVYQGCEDLVEVVHHPSIKVKGKDLPIEVIEVVGWKGQGRATWAGPLS